MTDKLTRPLTAYELIDYASRIRTGTYTKDDVETLLHSHSLLCSDVYESYAELSGGTSRAQDQEADTLKRPPEQAFSTRDVDTINRLHTALVAALYAAGHDMFESMQTADAIMNNINPDKTAPTRGR